MKLLTLADPYVSAWAGAIQRRPKLIVFICLLSTLLMGMELSDLKIATNYKVYFSDSNPEVLTYESFQSTYTKGDNFFFVLIPKNGTVFSERTLQLARELTRRAWQLPYASRVDSVTNFQHSHASGDDLQVADLVTHTHGLTPAQLAELQGIAVNEPLLNGLLLSPDASAMAVNVSLRYPEVSLQEVPQAAAAAQAMIDALSAEYPDIEILLSGTSMLNNAFAQAGLYDLLHLTPAMYLLLFVAMWVMNRSALQASLIGVIVLCSSIIAMGYAAMAGIEMSPISFSAPVIIATIAVASANHILLAARQNILLDMPVHLAVREALAENFFAITLTAASTLLGFLAVNASESPPLRHLGMITAVGIAAAWVLSMTLLPALLKLTSISPRSLDRSTPKTMERYANVIVGHRKKVAALTLMTLCLLASATTQLRLSDDWFKYIQEGNSFRQQSDRIMQKFGLSPVEFSIPAQGPGGVSDPAYLARLQAFVQHLQVQPHVVHVYAIPDILKRLNMNMHGDDPLARRLPESSDTAAQFLLLYEMSLPYGLDLNDRINIDKSASRVTVMLGDVTTEQSRAFIRDAEAWLADAGNGMQARATGSTVMVSMISQRNLDSLAESTVSAVLAICVVIALLLRSALMGVICLVSTTLPILAAFGVWALIEGTVGFSIAAVGSISIGIIIDDTVHFLTRYTRAKAVPGTSSEEAARLALTGVGPTILANTAILMLGFFSLFFSTFKLNVDMGVLTFMAIGLSLASCFLLVTPLLAMQRNRVPSPKPEVLSHA